MSNNRKYKVIGIDLDVAMNIDVDPNTVMNMINDMLVKNGMFDVGSYQDFVDKSEAYDDDWIKESLSNSNEGD